MEELLKRLKTVNETLKARYACIRPDYEPMMYGVPFSQIIDAALNGDVEAREKIIELLGFLFEDHAGQCAARASIPPCHEWTHDSE